MKLSFNKYYIVFNFIGWVFLFIFAMGGPKLFSLTEALLPGQFLYYWLETISCSVVAFSLSFIVSIFIDTKIDIGSNWKTYAWKVFLVFLFTQFLYNIVIWPILVFMNDYAQFKLEFEVTRSAVIYNFFFFTSQFIIWLFVFLTIKIYHQLKRVQLKQLQLEANLKESQLNTLKGQINPHFMFNSLNNIRGLMLEDVGKARNVLTNLSETLRYSLTKSETNSIALEDELEMVESYIEIAKIQYEGRLQFEVEIEEATLNKQIPPMIIQMLVENALKHGISKLKSGGKVRLTSSIRENQLHVIVVNSGSIVQSQTSTQLGIQNIKKRLELLYGNQATFSLKEKDNTVIATIIIPLT